MNRNDNPDVLPHPQFVLAPQGFAAPAQYGAPENLCTTSVAGVDMIRDGLPNVLQQPKIDLATTTVTGVDMNCDGIPNLLQQPQSGLPTMTVTQGDLTMEEREELENQLIAVRDELLTETRTLSSSTYQLLEWLYDADTLGTRR